MRCKEVAQMWLLSTNKVERERDGSFAFLKGKREKEKRMAPQ